MTLVYHVYPKDQWCDPHEGTAPFVSKEDYDALQARVDQLMWEFTPDEMTGLQKDRWAAAQTRSPASGGVNG